MIDFREALHLPAADAAPAGLKGQFADWIGRVRSMSYE
jgi:hypothetical protein